jgi:peptidoglycan/LPS O-acetylase OafA/YrhL
MSNTPDGQEGDPVTRSKAGATSSHLSRIRYLDGLRGFAALMVVLFHYWTAAKKPSLILPIGSIRPDLLAPLEYFGGARVSLFFVLSGFLLYLPFARDGDRHVTLGGWLWQRFRRVAPPYYAALLFALLPVFAPYYVQEAWHALTHQPSRPIQIGTALLGFPECLYFAHGMVPGKQSPMINAPLWTMTPEIQLYLTFPLLIFLARHRRFGGLLGTVTLAVTASVAFRLYLYAVVGYAFPLGGGDIPLLPDAYHCLTNSFLGRGAEFALGMGAAGAVISRRLPSPYLLLTACLSCLLLFASLRNGWAANSPLTALTDAAGGAAFALLLLCCAAVPSLARLFCGRPFVWVGTFAYSLYLVHSPVWGGVQRFLQSVLHFDTEAGGLGALAINLMVVLPIALGVARLFWWCFERPFLSRSRQESLKPRPQIINMDRRENANGRIL